MTYNKYRDYKLWQTIIETKMGEHLINKINNILGAGEIAHAISPNLNGNVTMYDKGEWEGKESIKTDVLHICIPYSDNFTTICQQAERIFAPDITIIHSTVMPGTTKSLKMLYSPVLARHSDDMSTNIKLYRKFVAGNKEEFMKIIDIFNITCEYWGPNTDELEYSKIMSTTRMYWDLVYQKEMERDCEKHGFSLQQTYYRWTDNYNAGIRLNHPRWERPMYEHMETNFPGGHCLRPNIQLFSNAITGIIRAWEKGISFIVS